MYHEHDTRSHVRPFQQAIEGREGIRLSVLYEYSVLGLAKPGSVLHYHTGSSQSKLAGICP